MGQSAAVGYWIDKENVNGAEPALNRIRGQAQLLSAASFNQDEFSAAQRNALFHQAETIIEQCGALQETVNGFVVIGGAPERRAGDRRRRDRRQSGWSFLRGVWRR